MNTKSILVTVMLLAGAGAVLMFFHNDNEMEKEKEDIPDVTSRPKTENGKYSAVSPLPVGDSVSETETKTKTEIETGEYGGVSPSLVGDPDSNPDPEVKSENSAKKKHIDTLGMTDYPDKETLELPPSLPDDEVVPGELAELESGNASTPLGEVIPDYLTELERNIASEEYIGEEEYIGDDVEYTAEDSNQNGGAQVPDDLAELERNIASEDDDEEYRSEDYDQDEAALSPVLDELAELESKMAFVGEVVPDELSRLEEEGLSANERVFEDAEPLPGSPANDPLDPNGGVEPAM